MLNQAAHPLAGASMTGADMLVQVLADEGVDTIFGYSGGAILPIYDAVFRYNQEHQSAMPLIVPANEQGAGFMAAGYARASGRVGVALVTSGPGATNTVTPVRDSHGRFRAHRGHLRPGRRPRPSARMPSRRRPCPASWAPWPSTFSWSPTRPNWRRRCARRSKSPAPAARARWCSTCRRTCRTGKACFTAPGRLPVPGYRQRMNRLEASKVAGGGVRRVLCGAWAPRSAR